MGCRHSRAAIVPEGNMQKFRTQSAKLPHIRTHLMPLERQLFHALNEYRNLRYRLRGDEDDPRATVLLTLAFINEMNAKKANIQGLLTQLGVEGSAHLGIFHSYFNTKDAALKEELRKRFHDGRIRVAAETMHVKGVTELLMPTVKEQGGSALF